MFVSSGSTAAMVRQSLFFDFMYPHTKPVPTSAMTHAMATMMRPVNATF
ncbi:Uncharacterised protein [Mycobacteroides abscessus subsp. abscessus]|nr:Uncharacterised protein [Mycobacteroides abscessus subsp. abscessus]